MTIPPPAPPMPGLEAIGAVKARLKTMPGGFPCRIRGTVSVPTGLLVADGSIFYIQDDSGGISVTAGRRLELHRGETVEVEGRLGLIEELEPEVSARKVTLLGHSRPVEPRPVTLEEAFQGKFAGELIRVRGRVMSIEIGETRDILFLGPAPVMRVYTRRPASSASALPERAPAGAEVEVTGVSLPKSGSQHQLRFLSPDDLMLRRLPPLLTGRQIALAACGTAGIAGIVIAWIVMLRASVRRQTAEIQKLLVKAEESSRAKSAFLANVSHEVRTPLNGVIGMLELAASARDPHEQRESLELARGSAESLRTLLDALLDLSKMEAGKLELLPSGFNPRRLAEESVRVFQGQAGKKGLELSLSVAAEVPQVLMGDSQRVRQILMNLVSNAVKFTERGAVSVTVSAARPSEGRLPVQFSVADTGIGIAADRLEKVFEPFYQADSSTTRRYGGTGLGLTISSHLARLMGGEIHAESEPGRGSVFRFTAPFLQDGKQSAGTDPAPGPDTPEPPVRRVRVLLAEDNAVNQKLVVRLLERRGHSVSVVGNGAEAVAAHAAGAYDLILMDLHMPEMDGLEATRRIRERERGTGRHTPVIAMTASTTDADRQQCAAAGMDGFLAKPVNGRDVIREVEASAAGVRGS